MRRRWDVDQGTPQTKGSQTRGRPRHLGAVEEVMDTSHPLEPEQTQVGRCGKPPAAPPCSHRGSCLVLRTCQPSPPHRWDCHLGLSQFSGTGPDAILAGPLPPLSQSRVHFFFLVQQLIDGHFLHTPDMLFTLTSFFCPCLEGPPS